MAGHCGNCGAPLAERASFCGSCGAKNTALNQETRYQPVPHPTRLEPVAASTDSAPLAPAKSNALIKVVMAVVAVVAFGGVLAVAGVIYAVHKVSEKTHTMTRQALGEKAHASGGLASLLQGRGASGTSLKSDPCRPLSKEDVSHAVGIAIIRAETQDEGCLYVAHGDPADMTSKHMASMLTNQAKPNGQHIDAQQQQMVQQITGAFFKQQESSDRGLAAEAAKGEVIVLAVSFDSKTARMAMKLTKTAFDHVKQGMPFASGQDSAAETGTGELTGLGDEAYEMGGNMLMVRKGDSMARFLFSQCPCSVDAIKPLAEKVVSQL